MDLESAADTIHRAFGEHRKRVQEITRREIIEFFPYSDERRLR